MKPLEIQYTDRYSQRPSGDINIEATLSAIIDRVNELSEPRNITTVPSQQSHTGGITIESTYVADKPKRFKAEDIRLDCYPLHGGVPGFKTQEEAEQARDYLLSL